ncbi:sulfite exporter TauE/SafE family protein [Acuticoccus mangrovi]
MGMMAMPLMLLVLPPGPAVGLMLPILMTQDAFSIWIYRGRWDVGNLKLLLPAAGVGVLIGMALFVVMPQRAMLGVLGTVTLGFAIRGLVVRQAPARVPHRAVGWVLGTLSGFTSTVLHQGGPPFQIYLIPQRLPRDVFAATTAAFFAIVNFAKLPGFIALGQMTREGLIVAAIAAPFALLMTWVGSRVVMKISPAHFYPLINLILASVGIKLITDALW